jgi:Tfp pilus assembly protein PilV
VSDRVNKHSGFMMAELIVAFTLLSMIVVGLAISIHGFGMFNRYQWARQQCLAAAQAQLDSIAARQVSIDAETCARLWPGVVISVEKEPGAGQWAGLQLIEVTATAQAGPRQTTVELARYVQPDEGEQSL